jgi:hypothetical protein
MGGTGGNVGQGAIATNGVTTVTHATVTLNAFGTPGGAGTGTGGTGGGTGSPGSAGAAGMGGAINAVAQTTLANSIVAANGSPACQGSVINGGHNIVLSDLSCGPGLNADPLLQPLADNGGPTLTRRPAPGSPAIDGVPATGAGCAATDQRLVLRPAGLGCDVGAYELAPPGLTVLDATAITLGSATLQGMVNPNARASSYHFEYGPTTDFGSSTPTQNLPAGVDPVAVNAAISGLTPSTLYHVRLVGTNADGAATSADHTFTTASQPGSGPSGGSGGDSTPVITLASVSPDVFAVNRKGAAEQLVTARVARGTTFRYSLSEAARVVFTIQRAAKGRKVGTKCVKPARANRRKHACTRYVQPRRFAKASSVGANTKRFSGRIGTRALKPGRYRATLVATNSAGKHSAPKRLKFRVVKPR